MLRDRGAFLFKYTTQDQPCSFLSLIKDNFKVELPAQLEILIALSSKLNLFWLADLSVWTTIGLLDTSSDVKGSIGSDTKNKSKPETP